MQSKVCVVPDAHGLIALLRGCAMGQTGNKSESLEWVETFPAQDFLITDISPPEPVPHIPGLMVIKCGFRQSGYIDLKYRVMYPDSRSMLFADLLSGAAGFTMDADGLLKRGRAH